ncbi:MULTISPECIES: lysophospholipid acyltransferase family protein [Kocuria]|jgi:1-acyl-sn-glycerol-3-phosphate acyltransferase|uniref:lysophospholipid acyltransferase family protein n=1 Tax=Kocuria TaxID=57493 RepID=UPI00203E861D|nr:MULTISPECIES: lysophospholipid acyltransferase family protein [Kocuria]MCM3686704.1 1-acyl-sn-glycerol-3-phosphate acyltransferase [Kocuria rosea]HST72899.1 lysophospholipid acyltransferase family protein [Kocuria rosea]
MSRTSDRSLFRVLAGVVKPVYRLVARISWTGEEHFPAEGGFVVVANHLTELDPLTLALTLYDNGIMPRFLAKESLFRAPVLGTVLRATGQVPVLRGTADAAAALTAARAELESGGAVVVYPEGTLTLDPEQWPMAGRTGAARLALATGLPVVPVAHWGDQEVLGRDPSGKRSVRLFPRREVRVRIGPPVDLSPWRDDVPELEHPAGTDRARLEDATEAIMRAVTAELAVLRGAEAPPRPWDRRRGGRL